MESRKLPLLDLSTDNSEEDTFEHFCLSALSPIHKRKSELPALSMKDLPMKRKHPTQSVSCRCKQSRCLKLYCECFASNSFCGPECGCKGCKNKALKFNVRKKAVAKILLKNPHAFFRVGCNCRKSECLKNYCECYHDGRKCSEHCNCQGCKNFE